MPEQQPNQSERMVIERIGEGAHDVNIYINMHDKSFSVYDNDTKVLYQYKSLSHMLDHWNLTS